MFVWFYFCNNQNMKRGKKEQEDTLGFKILKFRSFVSKQEEGFVFIFDHQFPEIVFEDLLFQLFQPIFEELSSPEIYYFSSTDQIITYNEMIKLKDYVYVHFLDRVNQYTKENRYPRKLKIGNLDKLSKGIEFEGANIYIVSQKYYSMYGHDFFYKNFDKKIQSLPLQVERKSIKYEEYCQDLQKLTENQQFFRIKQDIIETTNQVQTKYRHLQTLTQRYIIARKTLHHVLKQSGIKIQGIKDLF